MSRVSGSTSSDYSHYDARDLNPEDRLLLLLQLLFIFQIKFVDEDSPTFMKQKHNCEFWIRGTDRGVVQSPLHTLPANTTCLYHLQGLDTTVSPSPVPFR